MLVLALSPGYLRFANASSCRWVYLFFFNTLWVWFPLWILYEAYTGITSALSQKEVVNVISYLEKKAD